MTFPAEFPRTISRLSSFRAAVRAGEATALALFCLTASKAGGMGGPTFVSGPPLVVARSQHTSVVLPNGFVIVVGGQTGMTTATGNAVIFNPTNGTYAPGGSMTAPRTRFTLVVLSNGKALAVGGTSQPMGNPLGSTEIYDPVSNQWTFGPPLHQAVSRHTATPLPTGTVLIAGGSTAPNVGTAMTEVYVQGLNQFFPNPQMSQPRFGHTATVFFSPQGPRVLIAGGSSNGTSCSKTTDIFDPIQNKMTPGPPMSTPRCEASAVSLLDGRILIAGGDSAPGVPATTAEIFSGVTGQFAPPIPMTSAHTAGEAVTLQSGDVLVAGGRSGSNVTAATDVFDAAKNEFEAGPTMETAREYFTADRVEDGDVVLFGGEDESGNPTGLVDEFVPAKPCNPAVSIAPTSLPNGKVGQAYAQSITISGGSPPFDISPFSADLPAGLTGTLDSSGEIRITGTPVQGGTYSFSFTVEDSAGCRLTAEYQLDIEGNCPPIDISPDSPNFPDAIVGADLFYSLSPTAGNGTSFTWSVTGNVPPGLFVPAEGVGAAKGALEGKPTTPGDYTFTVTATDSFGCHGSRTYTLHVEECHQIGVHVWGGRAFDGAVAEPYRWGVTADGCEPPYRFTAQGLPPGIAMDSATGVFSGTPTKAGTYTVTVKVESDEQIFPFGRECCPGSVTFTLKIDPVKLPPPCPEIQIDVESVPAPKLDEDYSVSFTATGGTGPYQYTIDSTIPGLAPDGNVLSGKPIEAGVFLVIVSVLDHDGCPGVEFFEVTVDDCPEITVSPSSLPAAAAGSLYSATFSASGGTPPITFAGFVPAGMFLSPNGQLGGVPADPGTHTFVVTATDANGCEGSTLVTLDIEPCRNLTLHPNVLANALAGHPYTVSLAATGGGAPYAFATDPSTPLPSGLHLDPSTGAISGTASAGTFGVIITATDSNGCKTSNAYTIVVDSTAAPDLTISKSVDLPFTGVGDAVTFTMIVDNIGTAATSADWEVDDLLPAGFVFVSDSASAGSGLSCQNSAAGGRTQISCKSSTPLAAGGQASLEIRASIGAGAGGSVAVNTATVRGGGETRIDNDSSSAAVTVAGSRPKVTVPGRPGKPSKTKRR